MRALLCCLVLATTACAGTETGNPSLTSQLAFDAHSSRPEDVSVRGAAGSVVVEEAWLSLGVVALERGERCTAATRFESDAVGLGDHAANEVAVTTIAVEPGVFCGLSLDFGPAEDLEQRSVLLEGTLPDGASFTLASTLTQRPELRAVAPFELSGDRSDLFLGFDVAAWLAELDWAGAEREADGSVLIDAEHNAPLLAAFEQNLVLGLELYRDVDGDASLDTDPELLARGAP